MDDTTADPLPPEPGVRPSLAEPDPAPERDEVPEITDPRDRGGTGRRYQVQLPRVPAGFAEFAAMNDVDWLRERWDE